MTIKISKKAFLEIEDAKEYYNLQQKGLGDSFKSDLKNDTILILSVAHQHRKPFY